MFKTFNQDRTYLENKYHKTSEPFDAFNPSIYHGYDYDAATGLNDDGIKQGLAELYGQIKDLPHPVSKAKAVEFVLDNTRIDVNEHDYFIGINSWNREIAAVTISKWHEDVYSNFIPEVNAIFKDHQKAFTFDTWADYDHSVPDWNTILDLGFTGILSRARDYRKKHEQNAPLTPKQAAYFDAIEIEYTAIIRFVDRLYRYSLTKTHKKAQKISECLLQLRDGAPRNIYEAMQLMYIYFMICECIEHLRVRSIGNGLDSTLYKFYKNDIENGVFTKEEIGEFLAYFMMQFSAIGNYWGHPFYMAGTGEHGESLVNDLSYLILDVYKEIGIYNPKIQVKINYNTPTAFTDKIIDMIRNGRSSFVFMCEPGMTKAMMSLGVTYNEARTCDVKGCYEFAVRANEVSTAPLYINLLKSVNLAINNGVDTFTGKELGIKTGEHFDDFDSFYQAYLAQLSHILDISTALVDKVERYLEYINPTPMFSAVSRHSLEHMQDAYAFGSKYNNTIILHVGFASAVDSLMAVKQFVFDEQLVSFDELKTVLAQNWSGYERLRAKILNSPHKFGNNDPETDMYAAALSHWLCMKENQRPNARGGIYKAAMHSALHFRRMGAVTTATPDGRLSGEEMSKNISPVMGMDKNGITALLHSVAAVDPSLYTEDFCVDVMLHPSAVSGNDGLAAMTALLRTYMKNDGISIHFNIFDADTLRDAQLHPERYQNLQVRVCGWNVLWNNMSRDEQDMYIRRADAIR